MDHVPLCSTISQPLNIVEQRLYPLRTYVSQLDNCINVQWVNLLDEA